MEPDWGVSVVVCCHNSAEKLPATLGALFRLKREPFPLEIIVVDNNSEDNTAEIALEIARRYSLGCLRIVKEGKPGLSFARRAGILAAEYEVIIFCDDDNHLWEEYAARARSVFLNNPGVGVIGGNGNALLEIEPPAWWPMFSKSFAVGPQGDRSGPVKASRGYVYGAGMCVRKSIMMRLFSHNFAPLLKDRKGKELSSGGDVEICHLLKAMGYEIWYDDQLRFDHIIDSNRLTWDYYIRLKKGINRSFPVTFALRLCNRWRHVSGWFFLVYYLRTIRSMIKVYFHSERNRYKAEVNRLIARSSLSFLILRPWLMIRTFVTVRKTISVLNEVGH